MSTLHMYPRGFMGAPVQLPAIKQTNHADEIVNSLLYDVDLFQPNPQKIPFNLTIESLARKYLQGAPDSHGWDFKESVFTAALFSFGVYNVSSWLREQSASKTWCPTHVAFLEDTFNYLSGKKRLYTLETWKTLLDKEIEVSPTVSFNDLKKTFEPTFSTRELIAKWCTIDGGFSDLVRTLQILFGN